MAAPKISWWFEQAHRECNRSIPSSKNPHFIVFPNSWTSRIESYSANKTHDICFLGNMHSDPITRRNRQWLFPFLKTHCTRESYIMFTDANTADSSAFSHKCVLQPKLKTTLFPKRLPRSKRNIFDDNYFRTLRSCKFCLAPAGDRPYSMRFFEAMSALCIPVVLNDKHAHRNKWDATIKYKYIVKGNPLIYDIPSANHNLLLFKKHHTLC